MKFCSDLNNGILDGGVQNDVGLPTAGTTQ